MNQIVINPGDSVVYCGKKFAGEIGGQTGTVVSKVDGSHRLVVTFGQEEQEKAYLLSPAVVSK